MTDTVIMPKLGFDMAEGTLVKWVAAEGEPVKKGTVLAEIETDKATVEVESTFEGTLLRHLVTEGAIVPVGDAIAVVGKPGEKVETPQGQDVSTAGQVQPASIPGEREAPSALPQAVVATPAPLKRSSREGICPRDCVLRLLPDAWRKNAA